MTVLCLSVSVSLPISSFSVWYTLRANGKETKAEMNVEDTFDYYHNDFLDESLVAAETSALHRADVGSQPSHKQEFGPLAHFITTLHD